MDRKRFAVAGRTLLGAGLGLAVAGLSACGSGSSSSSSAAAADRAATIPAAKKLERNGRWFTDEQGRVVIIHGTNMINKFAPYTPEALGFDEEDLRFLAENGFNGIRLGLTWAAVEPSPGQYDDAYIDQLAALAAAAARHGMLPVLDFHQDGYSERYGGNGAPDWANIDYGVPVLPLPGIIRSVGAGSVAIDNFWKNTPASDGIGLQDHYAAAWQHVARRFRNDPHMVFELFNEPYPQLADAGLCALPVGCPQFDREVLAPFYVKVLQAIRPVDPDRLIFVEPSGFFGLVQARTWLPAMPDPQVAFAFHNYCSLDLAGAPLPPQACNQVVALGLANAQAHFDATGEPNLLDEFGAFMADESTAGLLDQADRQMLSWMHWAYWGQDFGESATYGLINDISKAPEGDNIKQGLLKVLTRPSPRVIAGTPQSWSWDASTSTFQARYSTARVDGSGSFPAGATSDFFVHPRFFPTGYRVQVTGGKVTSARNASHLTVVALPGADEVVLSVTPDAAN